MRLKKRVYIIILALVFIAVWALISYGGATGLSEVDTTNNFGPGMEYIEPEEEDAENSYTEEDEIDSSALIDGFKERLRFAKSFSVDDEYVSVINNIDTVYNTIYDVRHVIVDGDNSYSTTTTTDIENGETSVDTVEQYTIRDGVLSTVYDIHNGHTRTSVIDFYDLRDGYFPITWHGDEEVEFVDGVYIVRGNVRPQDFANMVDYIESANNANKSAILNSLYIGDIFGDLLLIYSSMPYECQFDADTLDLISLNIDMTAVMESLAAAINAVKEGGEERLASIETSMVYTSTITIDPTLTVEIP